MSAGTQAGSVTGLYEGSNGDSTLCIRFYYKEDVLMAKGRYIHQGEVVEESEPKGFEAALEERIPRDARKPNKPGNGRRPVYVGKAETTWTTAYDHLEVRFAIPDSTDQNTTALIACCTSTGQRGITYYCEPVAVHENQEEPAPASFSIWLFYRVKAWFSR